MKNQKEFDVYREKKKEVDQLLKEIKSHLNGGKIKDVDWPMIGNMNYIIGQLKEIIDHLPEKN